MTKYRFLATSLYTESNFHQNWATRSYHPTNDVRDLIWNLYRNQFQVDDTIKHNHDDKQLEQTKLYVKSRKWKIPVK